MRLAGAASSAQRPQRPHRADKATCVCVHSGSQRGGEGGREERGIGRGCIPQALSFLSLFSSLSLSLSAYPLSSRQSTAEPAPSCSLSLSLSLSALLLSPPSPSLSAFHRDVQLVENGRLPCIVQADDDQLVLCHRGWAGCGVLSVVNRARGKREQRSRARVLVSVSSLPWPPFVCHSAVVRRPPPAAPSWPQKLKSREMSTPISPLPRVRLCLCGMKWQNEGIFGDALLRRGRAERLGHNAGCARGAERQRATARTTTREGEEEKERGEKEKRKKNQQHCHNNVLSMLQQC